MTRLSAAEKVLKAERIENWRRLSQLMSPEDPRFQRLKEQKQLSKGELLTFLSTSSCDLETMICVLREQRCLGAPIDEEIEAILWAKLVEKQPDDQLKIAALFPSQMSPLTLDSATKLQKE